MMGWFQLASHLHLPLQFVQNNTTSTEFVMWMTFLEEDIRRKELWKYKQECYLARLIAETRRSWVSEPTKVREEDCFVKFKEQDENKDKQTDVISKTENSKRFWLGHLFGIGKKK
jgi:hypothetical protein